MQTISRKHGLLLLIALLASCGLWLQVASETGDLWSRWTDHLRHEGEAVALLSRGLGIYTQTYAQATAGVALPCPQHGGLWADSGIPYPPLGVLLHAPSALAERAGWLSPARSHAFLCWLFGVAGLLATWLGAVPLRGWRRWLFVGTFGPLLVGSGLSGFYDPIFVVFALLAIVFRDSPPPPRCCRS